MASDNMPYFTCLDHTRASTVPRSRVGRTTQVVCHPSGLKEAYIRIQLSGHMGVDDYMAFSREVYTSVTYSSRINIWPSYDFVGGYLQKGQPSSLKKKLRRLLYVVFPFWGNKDMKKQISAL